MYVVARGTTATFRDDSDLVTTSLNVDDVYTLKVFVQLASKMGYHLRGKLHKTCRSLTAFEEIVPFHCLKLFLLTRVTLRFCFRSSIWTAQTAMKTH